MAQTATKPHKSYAELTALLQSRGMQVDDPQWVERKLVQVGYYRLSGYWYPCRAQKVDDSGQPISCSLMRKPLREERVLHGTSFKAVFDLYLFDKNLRLVLLDALERVEVHVRSVVAHELGYLDALAYKSDEFIDPKHLKTVSGKKEALWQGWCRRHNETLRRSREDWIEWHRRRQIGIPFWAVVEAWDFGTLSKYYSLLRGRYKGRIATRLGVHDYSVFEGWLRELNTMRNRCAHHARVWNQTYAKLRDSPNEPYFQKLDLSENARTRVFGYIAVLWFLLQRIGPSSTWIDDVANAIDQFPSLPGCSKTALGLDQGLTYFPLEQLGRPQTVRDSSVVSKALVE